MKKKSGRRILSLLMAMILLIGTLQVPGLTMKVRAESVSGTVGSLTWNLTENGLLTISGNGAFPDVSIPWETHEVKQIIIGSGVTDVTEADFVNCVNLEDINVEEENLAYSSEDGVLFNKDKTRIIKYPSKKDGDEYTVPDSVTVISDYAFNSCSNLISVALPAGTTEIDAAAFSRCSGLKEIYIPDNVSIIGKYAFDRCSDLEEVIFPAGLTSIGECAFRGCSKLTCITFPDSEITIGKDAFIGCSDLEKVYYAGSWPANMTIDSTTSGNDCLINAKIDRVPVFKVTLKYDALKLNIGESADLGMVISPSYATDKNVTWESSDTSTAKVDNGTVTAEAPGIATITVKTVEDEKTAECRVTVANGKAFGDGWLYELDENGKLTISGTGAMPDFDKLSSVPWDEYNYIIKQVVIENGVTSIGDYAFADCEKLTGITLPDGVTSIGDYAFYGCDGLTGITLPDGVISIGDCTFAECSSLTSIEIPASVTDIGSGVFRSSESLQEINVASGNLEYRSDGGVLFSKDNILITFPCSKAGTYSIPSAVTGIGDYAFYGCVGLTGITIPSGVTSIGDYAFGECESLTGITIPTSVTSIGDNAFYGCKGLTSIEIPASVTVIGSGAFGRTEKLQEINVSTDNPEYRSDDGVLFSKDNILIVFPSSKEGAYNIPSGVTGIGDNAFSGCSGLTGITIPSGVTSIGDNAFSGCSGLTGITIPTSVTSIGDTAFSGCSGLTGIIMPGSVTSIGLGSFLGCNKITSVAIPKGVTVIGDATFAYCSRLTSITIPDSVTSIGDSAFHACANLTDVYYGGTETSWNSINISSNFNQSLAKAQKHYNSIPVQNIAFKFSKLELKVGESAKPEIEITPLYATEILGWSSSNTSVATVADGVVTAVAAGESIITVTSEDGAKKAICKLIVLPKDIYVSEVSITPETLSLKIGESGTLTATVSPENATNKKLNWTSSAEAVATVADGVVTAVAEGESIITVTTEDGGKTATCRVTVTKAEEVADPEDPEKTSEPKIPEGPLGPEKPDLSRYTASGNEMAVKSINLKKTLFKDVKGIRKFNVTAGDASAVKIKGGTLMVLKDATVTIEAVDKKKEKLAEKTVTVIAPAIDSAQTTEINRRGTLDLNKYILSTVQPSGWKSSNKNVAVVSENGLLIIKKSGTVKLTAIFPAEKGMTAKKLTIKLKVKMPQFKKTTYTVKTGKTIKTAVKNADEAGITYRTEDTAIATVDATGSVTGVSKGTTKLIMTVKGIDYETKIKVK